MLNYEPEDYPEYKKQFDDLFAQLSKKLDEVEAPKVKGYDGQSNFVYKKYIKKIKELQNKYSYLYDD